MTLLDLDMCAAPPVEAHQLPLAGPHIGVRTTADIEMSLAVVLDAHIADTRGETLGRSAGHLALGADLDPRHALAGSEASNSQGILGLERGLAAVDQPIHRGGYQQTVDGLGFIGHGGRRATELVNEATHG